MLSDGGPLGRADEPRWTGLRGVFRLDGGMSDGKSDIIADAMLCSNWSMKGVLRMELLTGVNSGSQVNFSGGGMKGFAFAASENREELRYNA